MDRLQAMRMFVTVVDCGGFSSAARKLNVSPPLITRAVGDLEQRLGVRLLTRTTRIVRVTDAGATYADDCRRVLADVEAAEQVVTGSQGVPRGRLVITAPVLFGTYHVMPVITAYMQRYPEVEVQSLFVDRVMNIVEDGIDVAVRIGHLPDSWLQAAPVGQVRRVLVASPDYLRTRGTPSAPTDLQDHTLISVDSAASRPEWRFVEGGSPRTVRVNARLKTTTNDSAVAAAAAGIGIARLMSYQVAHLLSEGRLACVLEAYQEQPAPIHVVHHEGRRATPKVRRFIEMAVTALRANPALT